MRMLKSIMVFFFSSIPLIPFSYGQGEPTTFDEIGRQLQKQACSAGENRFNKLAFGVTNESNSIIKGLIKENGKFQAQEESVHQGETAIDLTVFVCDRKMSYCALDYSHNTQVIKRMNKKHIKEPPTDASVKVERISDDSLENSHDRYDIMKTCPKYDDLEISPEGYEIITKITESMVAHTNKEYMRMSFSFYNDDSTSKSALNWHIDCCKHTANNPDFVAFAVLDITRPIDPSAKPPSKLRLGFINEKYEVLYHGGRSELEEEPTYQVMGYRDYSAASILTLLRMRSKRDATLFTIGYPNPDNRVTRLAELKNCTGTGYIIDQSMTREDGTKIVHSRDVRPYDAVRVSMIIRCYCSDDENEMMKDSYYREIKAIGDKDMYLSALSRGDCKKRAASDLEKLAIPSSGPGTHKKYKRSSSIPIAIEGAGI
ncbi:MAG: hypothetical protein QS748_02195 [Candidatus Endonucleobacter bathymodioli]|uniref:Uncharacterized protein n=1 Tax=Candidatus Endonucleibacter bathymodioli TaxID=539814 RepID=A0AA90NPH5_9GAMM|nr:hypothetical protein [Candidatus Endonucleobacter bathymodioli]